MKTPLHENMEEDADLDDEASRHLRDTTKWTKSGTWSRGYLVSPGCFTHLQGVYFGNAL